MSAEGLAGDGTEDLAVAEDLLAAEGLAVPELAVLGVDPGRRWTAGVLRRGGQALDGWTLGPVDAEGRPDAPAAVPTYARNPQ